MGRVSLRTGCREYRRRVFADGLRRCWRVRLRISGQIEHLSLRIGVHFVLEQADHTCSANLVSEFRVPITGASRSLWVRSN